MLYDVKWKVGNEEKEMDIDTLGQLADSLHRIESDGAIESAIINAGKLSLSFQEAQEYLKEKKAQELES